MFASLYSVALQKKSTGNGKKFSYESKFFPSSKKENIIAFSNNVSFTLIN